MINEGRFSSTLRVSLDRFCEFIEISLQAKPARKILHTKHKIGGNQKDKSLDVANVLSHSFKLSQDGNDRVILQYEEHTVPIRNVIDVRDALLGTFDDPIKFLVPSEHLVTLYDGALRGVSTFQKHTNLNADSFNIKNNTKLINTVLETK